MSTQDAGAEWETLNTNTLNKWNNFEYITGSGLKKKLDGFTVSGGPANAATIELTRERR